MLMEQKKGQQGWDEVRPSLHHGYQEPTTSHPLLPLLPSKPPLSAVKGISFLFFSFW